MSDGEVLETLIKQGKELKARVQRLSDAGHVLGERFIELGKALKQGGRCPLDFPFDHCDAEAQRILRELHEAEAQFRNVEFRLKQRTSLE